MSEQPYSFLKYDYTRLNPDLGGSEVDLVYPLEVEGIFTTVDGLEEATLPLSTWLHGEDPFTVTEPVQFTGFLPGVLETDAPIADPRLPLYSRRFMHVLEGVGDFKHRTFATQIEDDVTSSGDEAYPLSRITENYLLVQLPHIDALDFEASRYTGFDEETGLVRTLSEVVLKAMPLPPIFRLKAYPAYILVSTAAREALTEAGIKGVQFREHPLK